ncbi:MAG: helix-turn-helix domain-containing protein [Gemmatimonadota bacterium]
MPKLSAQRVSSPEYGAPSASHAVLTSGAGPNSRRGVWLAALPDSEQRALRHVGLRITALRRQRRVTRAELALAADLNAAHLGTIERGESNATFLSLVRIAVALDADVSALIEPVR